MTKIIIDAFGADEGPAMVARAVRMAREKRAFEACVVGPEASLSLLNDLDGVEILPTDEYVTNEEAPTFAIRRKKNASIVLALHRLNEVGDVLLSAGSTGALLAGGYFITKRIKGMERLCLAPLIPRENGGLLLADAGATMDTTPEMLLQFAQITALYAERALGRANPQIGLLNVGTEAEKGDKRTQETYRRLEESGLHFIGNVEARDILTAPIDVLIADGFAGNVALKSLEGAARTLTQILKGALLQSFKTKLGAVLIKDALKEAMEPFDYRGHGGAPLLGARKPLYKAHGNSSAETFALAILEALDFAESGVIQRITEASEEVS